MLENFVPLKKVTQLVIGNVHRGEKFELHWLKKIISNKEKTALHRKSFSTIFLLPICFPSLPNYNFHFKKNFKEIIKTLQRNSQSLYLVRYASECKEKTRKIYLLNISPFNQVINFFLYIFFLHIIKTSSTECTFGSI